MNRHNEVRDEPTFVSGAKAMLLTGPLNILLVCIPIALITWIAGYNDLFTFIFALLSIAPLAERLGFVTETLALHTNDSIGGLLNATFGNATELIVAITALSKGLFKLVQLSLVGSILSNMLLVLGSSFFFGGLYNKTQTFSIISSQINGTLLTLAVMAVLFPSLLITSGLTSERNLLGLSRFISLVLFGVYFAFLTFQLFTHRDLYEDGDEEEEEKVGLTLEESGNSDHSDGDIELSMSIVSSLGLQNDNQILVAAEGGTIQKTNSSDMNFGKDEEEEDQLGFHYSIFWLFVITLLIAVLSDALSSTIENAATKVKIPTTFIAAVILPIVGNAAEHVGAVMFAAKGKLELTLGVAIGSSTQIALMVLPLLVLLGWMMDERLDLDIGLYESFTLFVTVLMVTITIKDGTSNWLTGFCLIMAYFVIGAGFYVKKDEGL